MKYPYFLLALACLFSGLFGQGFSTNANPPTGLTNTAISGWDIFRLGDPYPMVVSNLQTRYPWMESTFDLEGDISLPEQRRLILIKPNRYFSSVEFHFRSERLFNLRLSWNPKAVSFLELIRHLTDRYGEPTAVSFPELSWQRGGTTLLLERPNTVKYIDVSAVSNQAVSRVSPVQRVSDTERNTLLSGM